MSNEALVAVVILNYNGQKFLEKFLPGVIKHSSTHAIYVADNGSTDGSQAYLTANFPSVHQIDNNANVGYAGGYNMALKNVKAKYYVLLNSDVAVPENWLTPMITLMEDNPKIAACQPKILDEAKPNCFEYAGASGGFIDRFGYPFCRGRVFNHLEKDIQQYNNAREVFWATGACLFVRAETFWEAGGFDTDYFAHMEEIDLCWRLKNLGYQIYVQPASVIYHVGGGTLNKLSTRKTYLNFRNNLTTLTKNHPPKHLFFKIFIRLILDGVAGFKFLFDGQPSHSFAVFRAHMTYYRWLPKTLSKRKSLKQKNNFAFNCRNMYQGNVVFEHFVKGKKHFGDLDKGYF